MQFPTPLTHALRNSFFMALLLALLSGCAGPTATLAPTQPPPATAAPTSTSTPAPTATASPTPTIAPTPLGPLTWSGKNRPLLMAHYMPWYQAPPTSASWGYHWTMDHFSPTQKADGTWQNFASHYTPLTGLYDSSDPAVLDYQVQLMKLSGIDGVIVDWYGMEDFWDYSLLNNATGKLFAAVKKAGLKFAICYEDQTVMHMVANQHLEQAEAVAHGQKVMAYLNDTWFSDDAYLKVDGRPVLFIFGPQYFKDEESWKTIFSALPEPPVFVTLDHTFFPIETAAYPWPPMGASVGGVLSQATLASYLNSFYDNAKTWKYQVGGAFPGFHDMYKEAKVSQGYGLLDAQDGRTFRYTLQTALDHSPDLIQLITWNDYGEGTNIEPALEYGYRYLEMVQEARKATDNQFAYTKEDLRLPLEIYQLRLKHASDAEALQKLDQAGQKIVAGDVSGAKEMVAGVR